MASDLLSPCFKILVEKCCFCSESDWVATVATGPLGSVFILTVLYYHRITGFGIQVEVIDRESSCYVILGVPQLPALSRCVF